MKKIFLLFLIVSTEICFSQPIGDTWYYSYQNVSSNGYVKLSYVKDTLINGKLYSIMGKQHFTHNYPGYYDTTRLNDEYVRWVNDSVFRIINNEEILIFSFNSIIGDTVACRMKEVALGCDSIGYCIVDSIGYINISGTPRKWIAIHPLQGSNIGYNGKIVSGVGPIESYLFPEYVSCVADANEGGFFRCITENNNVVFSMNIVNECDYINAINNYNFTDFEIFPNPGNGIFTIDLGNRPFSETYVSVYDIAGVLVYQKGFAHDEAMRLNLEQLPAGVYPVIIQSNNLSLSNKIVKLN